MVNFREGWRGHLWQGRFSSFVLDERYVLTAARLAKSGRLSVLEPAISSFDPTNPGAPFVPIVQGQR